MANIIELKGLTKRFGALTAVDAVDLAVREGEFITLLGPSGCGKTTTLRMIGGFEFPDAGRVFLDGRDVTDWAPYERPVNMTFQDYALFPHMNVAQNVGYGLRIRGVSRGEIADRVAESLRMVDLSDKAASRPAQLSNGQRQRVALARALIRKPRVLLLDEPLSALDLKLREAMQVELKHLHQQLGLTFVVVTHDQTEALVMSDRIVVMHEGRIMQDGTPTELYEHPANPFVANFIGASNLVRAEVTETGPDGIEGRFGANTLRAAGNGVQASAGDQVTFCVRPEKVRVLREGEPSPPGASVVRGRATERFFHGNSVRVAFDVGAERPFVVDLQLESRLEASPLPREGQEVSLAVHPTTITVFRG